ncbi:hypothetical protein PS619_02784 [Pseudomonas fluorescens]|nr:hypothetical protein PS619_02784 [Pseudomonas fluorescens]
MAGVRRISIRCGNRFKCPPMDRRRYLREQARSHIGCISTVGASLLAKRPSQAIEISELPITIAEAQQIQHTIQP